MNEIGVFRRNDWKTYQNDSNTIIFAWKVSRMLELLNKVNIQVKEGICLKDPSSSELGNKIFSEGVRMIDEIGMESFTFKKLADAIGSTEASIYRYFENKHKFLLYLTSWYWSWTEYRMVFRMANIESCEERLERAIALLTNPAENDLAFGNVDQEALHRIVISESGKSFMTKDVDEDNRIGAYVAYKQCVSRVSELILELNPNYKYPHMLVSTVIEGAHHQRYFAEHLPRLTDVVKGEDSVGEFYRAMVFNTIQAK